MDEKRRRAYHNFLDQSIYYIITENGSNQQKFYQFLADNLDQLDDNLPNLLEEYSKALLSIVASDETIDIANCMGTFGDLIVNFNLGNKANNIEIGIAAYNIALPLLNCYLETENWVIIKHRLGIAYSNRIKGDRSSNIEQTIKCYQAVSEICTQTNLTSYWATNQLNLGSTYFARIEGNRAENMEQSLQCYQAALQFYTYSAFPQRWADTQSNLGFAYQKRIKGDSSLNLEMSISCSKAALDVYTQNAFPWDWARTHENLGDTYQKRLVGKKSDNLEQAISHYEAALRVFTKEEFPQRWAIIQISLAIVYLQPIRGEIVADIESAIRYNQASLEVHNREIFPEFWALIQSNLGVAYIDRIKGDRAQNLELAISYINAALEVYTRSRFPLNWAKSHQILGDIYQKRVVGKKSENLETTIAALESALQVYNKQDFPEEWARTQNYLGTAYNERIEGEIAENVEKAISYHEAALTVFTKAEFPQQWATTQDHLGTAYGNRIRGDVATNLETQISYYQASLQVDAYESFPRHWALTMNNLSTAYHRRIKGDRADNIEQAIQYVKKSLQIYTREILPKDWARSQQNLGVYYFDRIKGDRTENIEQAIQYYQSAMLVYASEAIPQDWGNIQFNLGSAYGVRIAGQESENLEQAIRYYESALLVHTRSEFPQKWAEIKNNLARVYFQRIEGDRAENLEQAIECTQAALQVQTRDAFPHVWADKQSTLGQAYYLRICGEKSENIKAAIACYQAALQVYTRKSFPRGWMSIMNGLGIAYRKLEKIDEAIAYFRLALEITTPIADPIECLRYGRNLGETAFSDQRWAAAIEGYDLAIKAIETSRSWTNVEARRQEILNSGFMVYADLVQACINCEQFDQAIEYAERSRCQSLVDLMASNDLSYNSELDPQVYKYLQEYENIQRQIDNYHQTNNSGNSRELSIIETLTGNRAGLKPNDQTIKNWETQKQQIWEQLRRLDPVLAGQIQVTPIQLAAIQQLIDYPTAILGFYTTINAIHIFIVRQKNITYHSCNKLDGETFSKLLHDKWLTLYLTNKEEWQNSLISELKELAELLDLENLINQHLSGVEELIIIPHLYLHLLPFAALPIENSQYLGDKFLIRYIPSCQILEFCQKRSQVDKPRTYGTIEDATEDLPCSSFEGVQIAQLHNIPRYLRLNGRTEATVNNYRQLLKEVQVIISSHHAQARFDNPLESKLILSDGSITLGQLLTPEWRLPHLVDVFLSCCETGLVFTAITDDVFTLASGFLCAGARSVVSTLWAVDDLATALFSIFYHQYRHRGSCRPAALQQAQEELRTLSGETLATIYQPQINLLLNEKFQQLDQARKEAKTHRDRYSKDTPEYVQWDEEYKQNFNASDRIRQTKNGLQVISQEAFPFSHPFYWAAFICSGLR